MFIHRQTLSKQFRVVLPSYIPLPLSLGIGNIKTAAPTSKVEDKSVLLVSECFRSGKRIGCV